MKKNPENMTRSEIELELASGLGEERLITVAKMRREGALRGALNWFENRDIAKAFDRRDHDVKPQALVDMEQPAEAGR